MLLVMSYAVIWVDSVFVKRREAISVVEVFSPNVSDGLSVGVHKREYIRNRIK